MSNVLELPVGDQDVIRTCRILLQAAEDGEIDGIVAVCSKQLDDNEEEVWASWSDMLRRDIWWYCGWLTNFARERYF